MAEFGMVTLVVRDYDEAIKYYVDSLGFALVEDTPLDDGKRWVVVAPTGPGGGALLLAQATTDEQTARIGDQTGGRVGFFLYTDDFDTDYTRMLAAGVEFETTPRREPYGTVVLFKDLYGNRWDFISR